MDDPASGGTERSRTGFLARSCPCSCLGQASSGARQRRPSDEKRAWWPRLWSRGAASSQGPSESALSKPSSSSQGAENEALVPTSPAETEPRERGEPSPSSKTASPQQQSPISRWLPHLEMLEDPSTSLETRCIIKQAMAKVCLTELVRRAAQQRSRNAVRSPARRALSDGESHPGFGSPKPRALSGRELRGGSSSSNRQLVPAMVLPRWESLGGFAPEHVEASKLQLLPPASTSYAGDVGSLVCTICGRPTGAGEAILALVCTHVFCPVCFERFLRRRWAELASNQVESSETEQIPCPLCGVSLQRHDVHTLTGPEVAKLVQHVASVKRALPEESRGLRSPERSSADVSDGVKLTSDTSRSPVRQSDDIAASLSAPSSATTSKTVGGASSQMPVSRPNSSMSLPISPAPGAATPSQLPNASAAAASTAVVEVESPTSITRLGSSKRSSSFTASGRGNIVGAVTASENGSQPSASIAGSALPSSSLKQVSQNTLVRSGQQTQLPSVTQVQGSAAIRSLSQTQKAPVADHRLQAPASSSTQKTDSRALQQQGQSASIPAAPPPSASSAKSSAAAGGSMTPLPNGSTALSQQTVGIGGATAFRRSVPTSALSQSVGTTDARSAGGGLGARQLQSQPQLSTATGGSALYQAQSTRLLPVSAQAQR